jgi:hypothetical protein
MAAPISAAMTKTLAALLFAFACSSAKIHNGDLPDAGTDDHPGPGSDVSTCLLLDCPLGCGSNGCLAPVPSNGLAGAFEVVPATQDIVLGDGDLDVDTSTFLPNVGSAFTLPSIELTPAPGGAPIRAIVGRHIAIDGTVFAFSEQSEFGPALALLATEQLDVPGALFVFSGSVDVPGCSGAAGTANGAWIGGGGGGAFATAGGAGGVVAIQRRDAPADAGSAAVDDPALVPLRGGCIGGASGSGTDGGAAGGAVQLYSAVAVSIGGTIDVDGVDAEPGTGGGAGGGILIEAPTVELGDGAALSARGGGGASGDTAMFDAPPLGDPTTGASCQSTACGAGGAGASSGSATAQPGGNVDASDLLLGTPAFAGGGGGGLGYVRINTAPGQLLGSAAVVSGVLTTGAVATE